jgi:hypothetical protein
MKTATCHGGLIIYGSDTNPNNSSNPVPNHAVEPRAFVLERGIPTDIVLLGTGGSTSI